MKKTLKTLSIISFLLLFSISLTAQNGTIKGRVFNATNNEPIPFANITIWGTTIGSTSDLDGNFTFTGIEPGYVRLAATSIGFEQFISEDILVTNAKTVFMNLPMVEASVQLETVVIRANPFKKMEESPVSLRTLDISEIEKNPGGNRDISRVIQSLPGVSSTVSFRNDLIIRGGGPTENVFYLDGIEIPYLNHFSTQGASGGPVGIINVDFVREVNFYSGAFPADRGNTLSSVFEFNQIDGNPEKVNFKATLGASDIAFAAEGPAGKKSNFIFSVRRSYLGLLFGVIGLPFLPTYNDVQFKYKIKFDQKNELSFIGLGALDQFELNTGIENPDESQRYILSYLPVNEQYSYAIGAVYKHYREKGFDTWVISRNFLNNVSYKYFDNLEVDSLKTFDYKSTEAENKIRYEHTSRTSGFKINYGAGLNYAQYTNKTFQKVFLQGEVNDFNYSTDMNVLQWNAFGQISKPVFNDRLVLSFGLRMDANDYSSSMSNMFEQLSPRFSASYALSENLFLNFNTGRYFQRPAYTMLGFRDNNGTLVNKENDLKYIQADHIVAGIEFLPDENSKITVEGFYKEYSNYPFSILDSVSMASKGGDFGSFGDEPVTSDSEGRSYGFEVLARDKNLAGFNLMLSYTFVRSEFTDINKNYIPSSWDNRHILNLTVLKKLKKNWDVGAKYRFVGGAPYTPFDYIRSSSRPAWDIRGRAYLDYGRFNTERFGNFHQLDVRVDKQYFFDKWSLLFYLDIQNILNFKFQDQDFLVNTDENGNLNIQNPNAPYEQQQYILRAVPSESGTVLPTLGIIVEF